MAQNTMALPRSPVVHDYPEDSSFEQPSDGRLDMAQDDVDAIIRNKRKVRDPKACYACHRRKVKCDRNLPCDSCVKRDHPELCSYERPTKKRRIALTGTVPLAENAALDGQYTSSQSEPNVVVSREQWESMRKELQELREATRAQRAGNADMTDYNEEEENTGTISRSDEAEREGIHAPSNQMGTMHLGSKSVLAYMMALGRTKSIQDDARSLLEENVLPKLGLDNETATYPFVDLWSTDSNMQDVSGLCSALPDDSSCREFFVAYRDVACTIYPVVPDTVTFESTLNYMLASRARVEQGTLAIDPDKPFGVTLPWLGLVFAVFASGAQTISRTAKERELTSQVFICCSYQALRMSNFMTHPSLETIQTSLIIGNVLSYNMNPGVAYIFLGMTLRMAFSIGLQISSQTFSGKEKWLRGRIWWALAWQDSHFSVSYDRPTSSVLCTPDIPYANGSFPGNRSYAESMYAIIKLTQEIIRERTLNPRTTMTWATIQRYKEDVASINFAGAPHLRDRGSCQLTTQHLERLALKLHSSYIISELCRPALKEPVSSPALENQTVANITPAQSPPGRRRSLNASVQSPVSSSTDSKPPAHLRRECIANLEETIAAYVELHSVSEFAARSWIGIQRAISAAFLLGTVPETNQEPRIRSLLRDLEVVIAQRTYEDAPFDVAQAENMSNDSMRRSGRQVSVHQPPLAESPVWARTMTRSLNALGQMNAALAEPMPNKLYPGGYLGSPAQTITRPGSGSKVYGMQNGHIAAGNTSMPPMAGSRNQYSNVTNLKVEPYSSPSTLPPIGGIIANMNIGPFTPESAGSSSDWNYGNMTEKALEYVQPALWGVEKV